MGTRIGRDRTLHLGRLGKLFLGIDDKRHLRSVALPRRCPDALGFKTFGRFDEKPSNRGTRRCL